MFSMKLSDYLLSKQITQKAFADKVGTTQPNIYRIIKGQRPRTILAHKIQEHTHGLVSVAELWGLANNHNTKS